MSKSKILLAEDDGTLRQELGRFLYANGYIVFTVEDGYQAVELTVREKPDLLLLDVHMPAGDGFSVYDRVEKLPELAVTPTIYMTREPGWNIESEARRHGGFDLLHKPFELDELLQVVRSALGTVNRDAA